MSSVLIIKALQPATPINLDMELEIEGSAGTNGASPQARCSSRLKAQPTKPRENRAKRGVTRGISG